MKNYNNLHSSFIVTLFILFTSIAGSAHAGYFTNHRPFYGFDVGALQADFEPGYGDQFFTDPLLDLTFFMGSRARHKFGYELGVTTTAQHTDTNRIEAGQNFPGGSTLPSGKWMLWETKLAVSSIYAGVNYHYPVTRKLDLFAFAGAAWTSVSIEAEVLDDWLRSTPDYSRDFSKSTILPVVRIGGEYTFSSWGMRLFYSWRKFDSLNPMKSKESPNSDVEFRMKNSNSVYLGVFFNI